MADYTVEITSESPLQISFDPKHDAETVKRCTEELLPLLVARVEVAVALLNLEETTHLDRKDAMQALDIKGSFYEQAALNSAKQSLKIATGEVTATQVGFPEFEVDSEPGRAD